MENSYLRRTQKDYSHTFKLQVVREVELDGSSISAVSRKYGIQGNATVLNWIKKFGTFDRDYQVRFNMEKSPEQKLFELEAQVRLLERQKSSLEQQLKFQQDKAIMFDMMIDIAENELNIPIRKKCAPEASNASKRKGGQR
jgi:transposase-like protein